MKTELPLKEEKICKEKIILFFSEDIGKPSLRCGPNRGSGSSRYNSARFLNGLWFSVPKWFKITKKKVQNENKEGSERQEEDIYKSKSTKGKKKNEI